MRLTYDLESGLTAMSEIRAQEPSSIPENGKKIIIINPANSSSDAQFNPGMKNYA